MTRNCDIEYFDDSGTSKGILSGLKPESALSLAKDIVQNPGFSEAYVRGEIPGNLIGPELNGKIYTEIRIDQKGVYPKSLQAI